MFKELPTYSDLAIVSVEWAIKIFKEKYPDGFDKCYLIIEYNDYELARKIIKTMKINGTAIVRDAFEPDEWEIEFYKKDELLMTVHSGV